MPTEPSSRGDNEPGLIRGLGLKEAISANVVEMLGIGPFITIPILIAAMEGPHAMLGWLLGAALAVCDGLVWAELGAAMPGAGGSYIYLREAYGPQKMGQLMSFLFVWMIFFTAPLSVATGAVGFAQYTQYLGPELSPLTIQLIAVGLCLVITFALYRGIQTIGRLSFILMLVAVGTILWVIASGMFNIRGELLFDVPDGALSWSWGFVTGLGGAALIGIYGYGGYNNICFLGGEVRNPSRNIPFAVIASIAIVALLYIFLNTTILGVVPWRDAMASQHVVSDFMEIVYGPWAARLLTYLVLAASAASVFALLLGYSRIPYAAAKDRRFFSVFGKLHPTKRFPHVSLLTLGLGSTVFCFLDLGNIIQALIVIQVIVQVLGQIVAVTLIRIYRPDIRRPFQMWGYPIPSLVAMVLWLLVLVSTGVTIVALGLLVLALGVGLYLLRARRLGEWPFVRSALGES
ncbi:MAG: APC family permease [Bryobacterales bacterium]|nr:APC family permease [Bryobacterales bacterium]MDE0623651.1 APC family permease [Bryobacterales bacterium]